MPERRTNPNTNPQAPTTNRALPEDWKLEANCATFDGPVMEIPTSLCVACPVRTQCDALYVQLQTWLTEDEMAHATTQYLGGVWGGEPKRAPRDQVAYRSVKINPCGDECGAPRHARGACRNHYNQQYRAGARGGQPKVVRLCEIPGCEEKHNSRGMCAHHYYKWRVMQADLGEPLERPVPEPRPSTGPIDEPTYAGYRRARRAGVIPTPEQNAAHAAYAREIYHAKKEAAA